MESVNKALKSYNAAVKGYVKRDDSNEIEQGGDAATEVRDLNSTQANFLELPSINKEQFIPVATKLDQQQLNKVSIPRKKHDATEGEANGQPGEAISQIFDFGTNWVPSPNPNPSPDAINKSEFNLASDFVPVVKSNVANKSEDHTQQSDDTRVVGKFYDAIADEGKNRLIQQLIQQQSNKHTSAAAA